MGENKTFLRSILPKGSAYGWGLLAFVGLFIRLIFLFKGYIGFNSDEALRCLYVKSWMTGDLKDFVSHEDIAGLRFLLGCVFYFLTGGWAFFGCLASIFLSSVTSLLWISWIYQKISKPAAWATAVAFAFPPVSIAYFGLLQERRQETYFWAGLMVLFSGRWMANIRNAILLGFIIAWSCWCEPFILFFAFPLLAYEIWSRDDSTKVSWKSGAGLAVGLLVGALAGRQWNCPFFFMGSNYLHWSVKNAGGMKENLSLLWNAFPQFWNGNMPLGYLQNSKLGKTMIPMAGPAYTRFLDLWTFLTFAFIFWGLFTLAKDKNRDRRKGAILILAPAILFLLFFIVSGQVWDALSFRYLGFGIYFAAMGLGIGFNLLMEKRKIAGISLLILWVCVQTFILGSRIKQLPDIFPSVVVANGFKQLGLTAGYANHWVSETARLLTDDEVALAEYKEVRSLRIWKTVHENEKIGFAVLDGLDDPLDIQQAFTQLESQDYHPAGRWPMAGSWSIYEFDRGK